MRPNQHLPTIEALRSRGLLFPAIVFGLAGLLLLQGALYQEPTPSQAPAPQVVEPPPPTLPSLRPDLEKTPLTYWSDYWAQLADGARSKIVLLGREGVPGIVVAPGLAMTSLRAADDVILARREQAALAEAAGAPFPELPGAADEPRLLGTDARAEMALFEIPGENAQAFAMADSAAMRPGSFVAAVTMAPDQRLRVVPGYLVATQSSRAWGVEDNDLELSFTPPPDVSALVDLDGDLVGVAVETSQGRVTFSSRTILQLLARLQGERPCHAIEVAELDPSVRDLLKITEGVLVEWIDADAFVPEPSVHAGDVLLSWGGEPVPNVWSFHQRYEALEPGALVRYRVLRAGRRLSGATVMPGTDCRPQAEPLAAFATLGLTLQWGAVSPQSAGVSEGLKVVAVAPRSPAARSGLHVDDWILAVGHRPLKKASALKAFSDFESQPRALLLSVRRADRVKLLAVAPPPEPAA